MTKRNVVHIEIPAVDFVKAGRFYADLFGWKIQQMPEMKYATWDAGDGSAGGFNLIGDEFKPGEVLIYVNSEDIDADLQQAVKLGGKIVQPKKEISGMGWYGIFKDPTGNRIALYMSMHPDS